MSAIASTGPGDTHPPSRLRRQLGVSDAVMIGLGSMAGAGVWFFRARRRTAAAARDRR